jgi:hypothetical protein
MLRKPKIPMFFTDSEKQHLSQTQATLRRLNRDALLKLQSILSSNLTGRESSETGFSTESLATQMIFGLKLRMQIWTSAKKNEYDCIEVRIGGTCTHCASAGHNDRADRSDPYEDLKLDPAHLPELEHLVKLAFAAYERGSRRSLLAAAPRKTLLVGIKHLIDALLKQRQHLQDTAPPPRSQSHKVARQKRRPFGWWPLEHGRINNL